MVRLLTSLFLALVTVFFSAQIVSAATYYVDDVTNNGNGSRSSPWNSIQHAVTQKNTVQPGDTILILPGTYQEQVMMNGSTQEYEGRAANSSVEGSDEARITIKGSDPDNPPVIRNDSSKEFQWLVVDVNNITFENLQFGKPSGITNWEQYPMPGFHERAVWNQIPEDKRYYGSGFKIIAKNQPVKNITLDGLKLYNQKATQKVPGWGGYFGIVATAANGNIPMTNIKIKNSYLENIETKRPSDGAGHECIRIDGQVSKVVVEGNTIIECEALAIDILGALGGTYYTNDPQTERVVIRNNTVKSMWRRIGRPSHPKAIYMDRAGKKLLVENNYNEGFSVPFHANVEPHWTSPNFTHGDIIVRGNVSVGNTSSRGDSYGLIIGHDGLVDNYIEGVAVTHNTIITKGPRYRAPIRYSQATDISSINNVYMIVGGQFLQAVSSNYPIDERSSNGNMWHSENASTAIFEWKKNTKITGYSNYKNQTGQDSLSIFSNPSFENSSSRNYLLKAKSSDPENDGVEDGIPLTTTTSGSTTPTTSIPVADAKYFFDGWGIEGEVGDKIKVGGTETQITHVNYQSKILTVNPAISYGNNAIVNYHYAGNAPSMGQLQDSFYSRQDVSPSPTIPPNNCPKLLQGDLDCSGEINILDFTSLLSNFGTEPGVQTNCSQANSGDLNCDGTIDILDFSILIQNFGI